ncbi:MAG: DUF4149 domain-containing protein [Myxococcales bacterium]|nr:DUF4149 domain-containing protein [Myxococcales bacterium]
MSETFSAADLEPGPEEKRAARRDVVETVAAAIAVLAAGVWAGGMVALGACAAPFVFELTPYPASGHAMGAAFARFDSIAIGCAVVLLGAELVRSWVARRRRPTLWSRLRRLVAIGMAACAAFIGLRLTPHINELHQAGVRRNVGPEGVELESAHKQAEMLGKIEVGLAPLIVALHLFTLRRRRADDDEDETVVEAPLPPGPGAFARAGKSPASGPTARSPASGPTGKSPASGPTGKSPASGPTGPRSGVRARVTPLDDEPRLPVEGDDTAKSDKTAKSEFAKDDETAKSDKTAKSEIAADEPGGRGDAEG